MNQLTNQGREIARYCRAIARARGDVVGAAQHARAQGWPMTADILERAAVGALDRTDGQGIAQFFDDIAAVLRARTLIGRMTRVRRVPFNTRAITAVEGSTAGFVAEGAPAPVSELSTTVAATLAPRRCVGLTAVSDEVLSWSVPGADNLLAADVLAGVGLALDRGLIDPTVAPSASSPGAITFGAPSTSVDALSVAVLDDAIRAALGTLADANCDLQTAAWVTSPKLAAWLATARNGDGTAAYPGATAQGGMLAGLPVLSTQAAYSAGSPTESLLALVEQAEITAAIGDGTVELATHAAVQLDDAPSGGAQNLVSLWQEGLVGFRATVMANWTRRRPGAVHVIHVNV